MVDVLSASCEILEVQNRKGTEDGLQISSILPKSENPGSPDSADNFEFSAERLSENRRIKITLIAEARLSFPPSQKYRVIKSNCYK